ncbi:VOC family protein [Roseovarius aestuarii]|uniref:Glyoxalase-like domain protein n=1 Tax=Roseovarius aestuarii TaxID=475083 RepID=A0A1X7BS59_9RHOB|nr:VOC family protein [Roseovarius aestuarii]SMC12443.1 Glyoxalase-like domain protein [Roseovarius aestuarii]
MPRLSGIRLSVYDPEVLADFYRSHLGMTARETADGWRVGYEGIDADILLRSGGAAYSPARSDRYWKIGITLPNVDMAFDQLSAAGFDVSKPHQFRDIGYMCHLSDPEGFQIELLQHEFEGKRPPGVGNPSLPLGGGARIGQITLRSGDIDASRRSCEDLGMRLLSVQPVTDFGFTLYFWAFTDDILPDPDFEAIENRNWLWKRAYTTLEIQHVDGLTPTRNPGYAGIVIEGPANTETVENSI